MNSDKQKPKKGIKFDEGKPQIVRGFLHAFPRAIEAVAELSEFGAIKYDWENWRKVPNAVSRYSEALARHLLQERTETYDGESGFLHAVHVAWCAMARLELLRTEGESNENHD